MATMQIHIVRNCTVCKGTKHTKLNIKPSPREMTAALPQDRSKILCCALKFYPVSTAGCRDRVERQHRLCRVCWNSLQTKTSRQWGVHQGVLDAAQQAVCWSLHCDNL